jgi:hypothetical protein
LHLNLPADQNFVSVIDGGILSVCQNVNKTFDKELPAFSGQCLRVVTYEDLWSPQMGSDTSFVLKMVLHFAKSVYFICSVPW